MPMDTNIIPVEVVEGRITKKIKDQALSADTFKSIGIKEEHIEAFIAEHPDSILIGRSAKIVGRQVTNEQKSRADLIALDGDGSLVVIEVKRDVSDYSSRAECLEMQAIRYAASYSRIKTTDELAEKIYARHMQLFEGDKLNNRPAFVAAKQEIDAFLNMAQDSGHANFNAKQKIILVASGFDPETISACAWLLQNGIDITLIRISPVKHENQSFMVVEQLLPVVALEDMFTPVSNHIVKRAAKDEGSDAIRKARAVLPTLAAMFEQGMISKGETVAIRGRSDAKATVVDHKLVDVDGEKLPWNEWAKRITGWSAVNIYANVELNGKTLDDLRWKR